MAGKQPQEPMLAIDQIQGNVLPGFNKDFQQLLFLQIVDVPDFKHWLGEFIPHTTTMRQVLDFRCQLKKFRPTELEKQLRATWLNIAFSHSALDLLGALKDGDFDDDAFKQGLWRRSRDLGDPTNVNSEGYQGNWHVGGEKKDAHLVAIIACDDPTDLSTEVDRVKKTITAPGSGAQLIFEQPGAVLPGPLAGHEHFGFRDGVSQPGIRGLISQNPQGFLTPRQNPQKKDQGKPGQDLLWPSEFVFGYPGQDAKKPVKEPVKSSSRLCKKWRTTLT